MKVLAPIISGKENSSEYIKGITDKVDKIVLLQIMDKEFMNKTSNAMGEIMQFRNIVSEIKEKIGKKRKSCEEITEWGQTIKKIIAIAILQEVDKVVLVKQDNKFYEDILKELKKEKIKVEEVDVNGN
jgi:hypothetical protein